MNNIPEAIAMVRGETRLEADVQYGILVTDDGRLVHAAWVTGDPEQPLPQDDGEGDK